MVKNLQIKIGAVSISVEGDAQLGSWEIPAAYRPFIVKSGKTDITLRSHKGIPDTIIGERVFDCPPIWTLYRHNGTSIIRIVDDLSGLERILVFPSHLEKADLYFAEKAGRFADPFYGPSMELLMVNYLAQSGSPSGLFRTGTTNLLVGSGIGPAISMPVRSAILLTCPQTVSSSTGFVPDNRILAL